MLYRSCIMHRWVAALIVAGGLVAACSSSAPREAQRRSPTAVDPAAIVRIEEAVRVAIDAREVPGAVLVIGTGDGVLYRRAFGLRSIEPPVPMTVDTIFDLASLTKPLATAAAIATLIDRGHLQLTDRVADYLPAFASGDKGAITIEQLLLHTAGLVADNALADYLAGPSEAWRRICALTPVHRPGERFIYSDVGYIVLGELVRAIDSRPLDQFVRDEIFAPLGMGETMFNPPAELGGRIAPTQRQPGGWLIGRVHDPRAAALGGVAGHAGLFGTANDLAQFCMALLRGGEVSDPLPPREGPGVERAASAGSDPSNSTPYPSPGGRGPSADDPSSKGSGLSAGAVAILTQLRPVPDGQFRTCGFDADTGYSAARGLRFVRGASFGHTGFTGTSMWIDPIHDLFVILLTSRLQIPDGGATQPLRRAVATYAAEAVAGVDRSRVLTGLDVLVHEQFESLRGRKVGLITNHTGLDRFGRRGIDLLRTAGQVDLVAIFSPEHGPAGRLDREGIADDVDHKSGLPIYSLYGQTRRPTTAMLRGLDALVFDIQDIGTRFYTYITTMGYAMEEAERHGLRFIVLDRPNPIMQMGVHGPLADEGRLAFTAYKPLPVVHGMTVGELARLFRAQYMPRLDLHVVPMAHYRRDMAWEDTGVPWVNPSPNMRSPEAAVLYPAIGLLEMTNVSVGRGTATPFEWLGAPWIDGPALAEALERSGLPGVRFAATHFTPADSRFAGERCSGVQITVTNRVDFEPVRTGLTIAWHLQRLHGETFESQRVLTLLASEAAQRAWLGAGSPRELRGAALEPPAEFLRRQEAQRLYR
jgi:uncharacterized protein YbbC (DUF1343 family)/CubicO group peptidase (beta-lactamase class C family)